MVDLIQNNKESNHDYNKRSINLILNLEKEIQNLNNKIRKPNFRQMVDSKF